MTVDPNFVPEDLNSLTPEQLQAAGLLMAGHSYGEICQALSIGRTTLYRWRQIPAFAAYLSILMNQAADETQFQCVQLLSHSLKLIQQQLMDPSTDPKTQLRRAERMLALYTRPSFLNHLRQEADEPILQTQQQVRRAMRHAGYPDSEPITPKACNGFLLHQKTQIEQAMKFDRRQAHVQQPPKQASKPAEPLVGPAPRTKVEQNGTSAKAIMTGSAMDAALSSVRTQIASVSGPANPK